MKVRSRYRPGSGLGCSRLSSHLPMRIFHQRSSSEIEDGELILRLFPKKTKIRGPPGAGCARTVHSNFPPLFFYTHTSIVCSHSFIAKTHTRTHSQAVIVFTCRLSLARTQLRRVLLIVVINKLDIFVEAT